MKNLYFELPDSAVEKNNCRKYYAKYNVLDYGPTNLHLFSHRIWVEEDNTIKYLKNKDSGGRDVPVDMDEFLMIKLRCHTL